MNDQSQSAEPGFIFAQIAEEIDEETWVFHLQNGHYSTWFRDAVKDPYPR